MTTSYQSLGAKVRELRKRQKLTQSELAGDEFTKSFISQVEKGQTNPSIKSLGIIAQRLGVPISYFLTDESNLGASKEHLVFLDQARRCQREGQLGEALDYLGKALSACSKDDHAARGYIHLSRAEIQERLQLFESTTRDLELAVEHLRLSHDSFNLARACNFLGHVLFRSGEHQEAVSWFRTGLRELEGLDSASRPVKVRLLVNLGIALSQIAKYYDAISTLNHALAIMAESEDYYSLGKVFHTLGYAHNMLGDNNKAIELTRKAIHAYKAIGNYSLEALATTNLALYMRNTGEIEEAQKLLLEVANNENADSPTQARAHANLAAVLSMQGEFVGALEYVKEALRLAPLDHEVPEWVSLIVECAKHAELPQEFLDRLEQLVDRWEGEPRGKAELHSSLGELYRLAGSTSKANDHLAKSVAYFKQS